MQRRDTLTVHAGEPRRKPYGSITMPIVQTSTYSFANTCDLHAFMQNKQDGTPQSQGEYGRYGNPVQRVVEERLSALEGADDALLLASGMAAITGTLLALLKSGDHLIITDDCYRRTRQFAKILSERWDIRSTIVPLNDQDALEAAIQPNTRLLFTETPTNPFLRVVDLEQLARTAKRHGLITVVDTTFATPLNLCPLKLGVDLVIHSATKYLGGHNDLLAGIVLGQGDLIAAIREMQTMLGAVPDPHCAYLLLRGIKTLGIRIERQNASGQALAEFLEASPRVKRVWYPGLASHPDHDTAARLMDGFGGVVSLELDTDSAGTGRFIDALKIPYIGPSLGGVESIVEQPALMSHYGLTPDERASLGISDALVRYAVGIEATEDLLEDVRQALDAIEE